MGEEQKNLKHDPVMAIVMYQPEWAMGCPDKAFLGVSVRVFLDEIGI